MGEEVRSLDSRKMTLDPQNDEVIKGESRDASPAIKSDASSRATGPADESLFTPRTSGAPSIAEEKCVSSDYSGGKSYPEGQGAFAKWESPPKTQDPPMATGSPEEHVQETSPNQHEARPATVASRGKKDGSKKALFHNFFDLFRSAKSAKSEKARLLDPDSGSTASEEESGDNQPQPHTSDRPLLYTDLTGQRGGFLPGPLSVEEDDLEENITDTTSISLGDKKCLPPSNPGSRVVSPDGSTGDGSSLEREFEELSSPTKSAQQGPKETKIQNEFSSSEDEAEAALGPCESAGKRSELQEADHEAGESKEREMPDK